MKKFKLILFSILFAQQVYAEPGPAITKMMQTPATAFDMFLFRLYESAKCNNVVKNVNSDEADLCLSTIKYDAEKNILSTFFRVLPGAEAMDDPRRLEAPQNPSQPASPREVGELQDHAGDRQAHHDPDEGEGDGEPTPGEPNFDATDISESDQVGIVSFQQVEAEAAIAGS